MTTRKSELGGKTIPAKEKDAVGEGKRSLKFTFDGMTRS